jgi:FAD/FMN-containing dehydrogenase
VLELDAGAGEVEAEAGIQWTGLIDALAERQRGSARSWGIVQKQTGADRLSLGGALAANVHGRGLRLKPIVGDVVALTLVDADGAVHRCDRGENAELFRLAIGGYGLFGVVTSVRLRLAPRTKVQRLVEVIEADGLIDAFERRIAEGCGYGDFQFSIDPSDDGFLRRGVFSCYRPVDPDTPIAPDQRVLATADWARLLHLAHADKRAAVEAYTAHYLATSGQIYWSDTHQLSDYVDDYHSWLDRRLGARAPASEVITELYVPRDALAPFLADVRREVRARGADVVYGTVRLIERDDESFLAWARQAYACVVLNLHVVHEPAEVERAARDFRRLIDLAIGHGGSFYLTYHRFASREQVLACYPRFPELLRLKRVYDPAERLQSDWYRHYRALFER